MIIKDEAISAMNNFKMPDQVGFGKILLPIMAASEYKDGKWSELIIKPYQKIELDPTCKVLHYGQEIFEGMKAYNFSNNGPNLFRPLENFERFNQSARRMAMPEIPQDIFMDAVINITKIGKNFVPKRSGESLYIRPFMFATENNLGIKPAEEFLFLVIASPAASYFSGGNLKVMIERELIRACPGGMGFAKTGGNYAGSLLSSLKVKKLGYDQTLWLSGTDKDSIEEMSGMNFFAVIDGALHTPALTDTILDGITRKSIISLAKFLGLKVVESKLSITDLIAKIKSKNCTEAFACGTAAILQPIGSFHESDGSTYRFEDESAPISNKLRQTLLGIQEKTIEDQFEWVVNI